MMRVPARISRYEIKTLIGAGGMGSLYLARDTNPGTNRLVALKLLNTNLDSGDLRQRFARESRALAALNHPNIVDIYDSGEFEGYPYIVMEYVRGETLAEKIRRRAPLTLGQKLRLMVELCSGLAHAHEAGIIHRDIKPANLMVDQHGRLKILDFGIARVGDGGVTRLIFDNTQVAVRIGTPGYMSPEQVEGADLDRRSDVFAVGAVLYELLAYREAFAGGSTREIEDKVLDAKFPPLRSVVPDVAPSIEAIVTRAMARRPAARFQDMHAFEEALERERWRLGPADRDAAAPRRTPVPAVVAGAGAGRGSKGDAAYYRAMEFYRDGALDTARRFAIEALAEDPAHRDAQALVARLGGQFTQPGAAAPPAPAAAAVATFASAPARSPVPAPRVPAPPVPPRPVPPRPAARAPEPEGDDRTVVIRRADLEPRRAEPETSATDFTVMIPSRSASPDYQMPPVPAMAPTMATVQGPVRQAPPPKRQREWAPLLKLGGLAAAVLVLLVGAGGLIYWLWPGGHTLTVSRPLGGTIVGPGISCGSSSDDCTGSFSDGESVTLEAKPDSGYVLVSWAGCVNGVITMNADRECTATFNPVGTPLNDALGSSGPSGPGGAPPGGGLPGTVTTGLSAPPTNAPTGPTMVLTIAKPIGGTIVAPGGINCGARMAQCAASYPQGSVVTLMQAADSGYSFSGWTGDCVGGRVSMTMARTCGAQFTKAVVATPVAPPSPPPRPNASATAANASAQRPTSPPPAATTLPTETPVVGTPAVEEGDGKTGEKPKDGLGFSPEQIAKQGIAATLETHRQAYANMDFTLLRRIFPDAPRRIADNWKTYQRLDYKYKGDPEYVAVDPVLGRAVVKVKAEAAPKVDGFKQPKPFEIDNQFELRREGVNTWTIAAWKVLPPK